MTKEELVTNGWELSTSSSCPIFLWGKHMVLLKQASSGRQVMGYGDDELSAINNAWETASKEPLKEPTKDRH